MQHISCLGGESRWESNPPEQAAAHTGFEDQGAHQLPFCSQMGWFALNHILSILQDFDFVNRNILRFTKAKCVVIISNYGREDHGIR